VSAVGIARQEPQADICVYGPLRRGSPARISNGLRKGDELVLAELHNLTKLGGIHRAAKHDPQAFRCGGRRAGFRHGSGEDLAVRLVQDGLAACG